MIAELRSELRKFITIRSTYVLTGLALALVGLNAFMAAYTRPALGAHGVQGIILSNLPIASMLVGVVGVLVITLEYRYGTIAYTLVASNSRLKILLAKTLVVSAYALTVAIAVVALTVGLAQVGAQMNDHGLGSQLFDVSGLAWKSSTFMIAAGLTGLLLGSLSRSIVFALVTFFLVPQVGEPILYRLLNLNPNVLPFTAQYNIIVGDIPSAHTLSNAWSPAGSTGVVAVWLVGAWMVTLLLLVRRDAN